MHRSSRQGVSQDITTGTASTAVTNAFGSQTYQVRLAALTNPCRYRVGDGTPTAVATDTLLPSGVVEYVTVTPGQKIAALQVTGAGTLNVTEVS